MLHPQNPVPPTLLPNDKPLSGPVPINNFPANNQSSTRPEYVPPPQQNQSSIILNNSTPVFSGAANCKMQILILILLIILGQDVDLRLDPRTAADPRLSRTMADQDMRSISNQLPNPLPPVGERSVIFYFFRRVSYKININCSFNRDPRAGYPSDPRQSTRPDPRQKSIRKVWIIFANYNF